MGNNAQLLGAPRSRHPNVLFVGTIVVTLAAVATLTLIQLATHSASQACKQEYKTVQYGLDAYMTVNNLATVPMSSGTSEMTRPVLLYNENSTAIDPTYVRNSPTKWSYAWDTMGRITAIRQAQGGPPVPRGCIVSPSL